MPGEKLPLLARAVGGRVLGPRPGLAVVSFWQGIVEIILRAVALVVCLGAIIPAALVLQGLSSNHAIDYAAAGIVLAVGVVGLILEVALITLRFVNVGIINMKSRLFFIVDMVLIGVVALAFLIGGIISAFSAHQWQGDGNSNTNIKVSLAASAALSLVGTGVFSVLRVWVFLFMLFKWNKHVVTYTLKDAVLG